MLPALGDELGGFLRDIKVGGMFPIPQIALFLEMKIRFKKHSKRDFCVITMQI